MFQSTALTEKFMPKVAFQVLLSIVSKGQPPSMSHSLVLRLGLKLATESNSRQKVREVEEGRDEGREGEHYVHPFLVQVS